MTAKEFVLKQVPKAECTEELLRCPGCPPIHVVRNTENMFYIAQGDTEAEAWMNAMLEFKGIKSNKFEHLK